MKYFPSEEEAETLAGILNATLPTWLDHVDIQPTDIGARTTRSYINRMILRLEDDEDKEMMALVRICLLRKTTADEFAQAYQLVLEQKGRM